MRHGGGEERSRVKRSFTRAQASRPRIQVAFVRVELGLSLRQRMFRLAVGAEPHASRNATSTVLQQRSTHYVLITAAQMLRGVKCFGVPELFAIEMLYWAEQGETHPCFLSSQGAVRQWLEHFRLENAPGVKRSETSPRRHPLLRCRRNLLAAYSSGFRRETCEPEHRVLTGRHFRGQNALEVPYRPTWPASPQFTCGCSGGMKPAGQNMMLADMFNCRML